MPFQSSDKFAILRFLPGLTLEEINLKLLEITDEEIIQEIQNTLIELSDLADQLKTERASAGLIKADVLEWESGGRTDGFEVQKIEYQKYLASLLGIGWVAGYENLSGSAEYSCY